MGDWVADMRACIDKHESAVLVTVAKVVGSSPRAPGTRMLVTANGRTGTVGGGKIELQATEFARDMLAEKRDIAVKDFTSESGLDQSCGGRLTLLFDRFDRTVADWLSAVSDFRQNGLQPVLVNRLDSGAKLVVTESDRYGSLGTPDLDQAASGAAASSGRVTRLETVEGVPLLIGPIYDDREIELVLFGAGHVGAAIATVLQSHPDLHITWIDDRPGLLPEITPSNVRAITTEDPAGHVAETPSGAYFAIMSHNHKLDFDIVERVLRRGDYRYCGLIGSAAKRGQFTKRWLDRGLPEETLEHLVCPIGVDGITGRQPADIAISVAAEILRIRDAG